jgi:hypothetical protein
LRAFFEPVAALVMFAMVGIATATIAAMTAMTMSNSIRLKPHLIDRIYGFFKMGSEEKVPAASQNPETRNFSSGLRNIFTLCVVFVTEKNRLP